MKTNRCAFSLILTILTVFAVLMTFSCSGLFTSPDSKPGMGNLTINLPGAGARIGFTGEDVDIYKISVISQETGELVIPTQEAEPGTFLKEIPVGTYSIIIQGMISSFPPCIDLGIPFYIGRTNNVSVSEGETTNAEIFMVEYHIDGTELTGGANANLPRFFDYGSGKLPIPDTIGCTFDGWYTDETLTTKITQWPDTTDWKNYKNPYLKLTITAGGRSSYNFPPAGTQGVYYVKMVASGDGTSPDNPMAYDEIWSKELENYTGEGNKGLPRIYLLDSSGVSESLFIEKSVEIIGVDLNTNGNAVIRGNNIPNQLISFESGTTCYIQNITFEGNAVYRGIVNDGNLTLDGCIIQGFNNTSSEEGGGIYSEGTLTLIETTITNCSASTGAGVATGNGATITLKNSTISGCTGGGLYLNLPVNGKVTIEGSTITGCGNNIVVATSSGPKNITKEVTPNDTVSSLGLFS